MFTRCGKCNKRITVKEEDIDIFDNTIKAKCEDCDIITYSSLPQTVIFNAFFENLLK